MAASSSPPDAVGVVGRMTSRYFASGALICAVLAGMYLWSARAPKVVDDAWMEIVPADIQSVQVRTRGGEFAHFRKEDRIWVAVTDTGAVAADSSVISDFLNMVSALQVGHLVTETSGKHELFEVSEDSSSRILLNDTGGSAIVLGKSSPDGEFFYMRRPGDASVYAIRSFDRWTFRRLIDASRR